MTGSFWDHSLRESDSKRRRVKRISQRRRRGARAIGVFETLELRCVLSVGPVILAVFPRMGAIEVDAASNITAQFEGSMDPTTISETTIELRDPWGRVVAAAVSYDAETQTATLDPTSELPTADQYLTVTIKGGDAGVKDATGGTLSTDFHWSLSTGNPAFAETIVFRGVAQPTAVKFSPDGRVFVAEKSGRIWVFDSLADDTPDLFANLHVNVHNFSDRGLLGMALAPDFPQDPHVYVSYTYDGDIPGTSPGGAAAVAAPKFGNGIDLTDPGPGDIDEGPWVSGRLSRLTASGNFMTGTEEVLIHDWPQQFSSHSVGAVAFGPDGALYVSAGEGANYLYPDYGQEVPPSNPGNPFGDPVNEGGSLRSQDLLTPDDPTTLSGTIIRVDPSTGRALPTNPLFNTGHDENARRIIAHGLRNPYRFTFRPGSNEIWIGDVGWIDWEEINRIVAPTDNTVENFGWPAYEGAERQQWFDPLDVPLVEQLYANGPEAHDEPYFAYHHFAKVDPATNEPISKFAAITGLAFGQGGNLPPAFDGALFFTDLVRNFIWVMYRGVDGLPDPTNVRAFYQPAINPVDLEIAPDGSLYYASYQNAIRRVRFVDANFGYSGGEGNETLALRVSSDGTLLEGYDAAAPNGEPPLFTWPMDATVPLPINLLGGDDTLSIEMPQGVDGPAGGIWLDGGSGANLLTVRGGSVRINSLATGGTLDTVIEAGAHVTTSQIRQQGLTLNGNGRLSLLPDGPASVISSLALDADAMLDIGENALVIDYAGTSPVDTIREKISSGRGGTGFGASWNGKGIISSTAAQANTTDPDAWSVGYAVNGALPLGAYENFRGVAVDDTAVMIAYTRTGDANLDGVVDDKDVTIVGATYAPGVPQPDWALGDFDYNGFVDDDDVTLLGVFYDPAAVELTLPRLMASEHSDSENLDSPVKSAGAGSASHLLNADERPRGLGPYKSPMASLDLNAAPWVDLDDETVAVHDNALIDLLAVSLAIEAGAESSSDSSIRRLSRRHQVADSFWAQW